MNQWLSGEWGAHVYGEFSTAFKVKESVYHCGIPFGVLTVSSELGNAFLRGMVVVAGSLTNHASFFCFLPSDK